MNNYARGRRSASASSRSPSLFAFWLLAPDRAGVDLLWMLARLRVRWLRRGRHHRRRAYDPRRMFGVDHAHPADGAGPAQPPAPARPAGEGARHLPPQRDRRQPRRARGRPHRRGPAAGARRLLLPRHRQDRAARLTTSRTRSRRRQPARPSRPGGQRAKIVSEHVRAGIEADRPVPRARRACAPSCPSTTARASSPTSTARRARPTRTSTPRRSATRARSRRARRRPSSCSPTPSKPSSAPAKTAPTNASTISSTASSTSA